ncbi:hypothetical protein BDN72DRAFT_321735 [Pluteus cervinus]|uniref:Uncharacterized protein n=1 Tax=Pluteus cervinus TaxID=181527 RepID=A0ACD3ACQ6_9AGAR|nr:hypothetical protein BDN72DRAFT_321735 [Pluteus cervinus]
MQNALVSNVNSSRVAFENMQPVLPPELEEMIFSLAYRSDRMKGDRLFLVARRVSCWLTPIKYEVIIGKDHIRFHTKSTIHLKRSDMERHGRHVRHLLVWGRLEVDVPDLLSLCPNLEDIAIWTESLLSSVGSTNISALTALRCTHLSINVASLIDRCGDTLPNPAFPFVTHLDITVGITKVGVAGKAMFSHFPALTHLAVVYTEDHHLLKHLVDAVPKLKVLVLIAGSSHSYLSSRSQKDQSLAVLVDQRIVNILCCPSFVEDWERGARGDVDMYKIAEDVIAERQKVVAGDKVKGLIKDLVL